jgi:hypothetical protein
MTVKKSFVTLVTFLEANKDRVINEVLAEVIGLASGKKSAGATKKASNIAIRDEHGNVIAINCYFFKKFMPLYGPKAVEFGKKASTNTGYNTMCKEGVSLWTKAQDVAKKAGEELLNKVVSGEIKPADIVTAREAIEVERKAIPATELGFDTVEQLNKYYAKNPIDYSAIANEAQAA